MSQCSRLSPRWTWPCLTDGVTRNRAKKPRAQGAGARSSPVTLTSHGKAFPGAGFLFKSLLPKSTLFNNDFNRVIHSKDHAVLGRIYISNKENLHSCRCPFNFSFSQISRQPWLPVEVQQGRGGAERHLGSHLVQPIK